MSPPNAPPPFLRSPTGEIDVLKEKLAEISTHLSGVSRELATERDARKLERDRGISITNISVPLLLVLAILGVTIGAGVTGSIFVFGTREHIADRQSHLDKNEVIRKGPPVYTLEMKEALASEASDRDAYVRRVERAVTHGAQCRPSKVHGEMICSFEDPETLKLRPP